MFPEATGQRRVLPFLLATVLGFAGGAVCGGLILGICYFIGRSGDTPPPPLWTISGCCICLGCTVRCVFRDFRLRFCVSPIPVSPWVPASGPQGFSRHPHRWVLRSVGWTSTGRADGHGRLLFGAGFPAPYKQRSQEAGMKTSAILKKEEKPASIEGPSCVAGRTRSGRSLSRYQHSVD